MTIIEDGKPQYYWNISGLGSLCCKEWGNGKKNKLGFPNLEKLGYNREAKDTEWQSKKKDIILCNVPVKYAQFNILQN